MAEPPGVAPAPEAPRPRLEDRRAQRAARRHRRQLALWCAVVIAVCLAITILIVIMAGNRSPGPQAVPTLTSAVATRTVPAPAHPSGYRGVPVRPGGGP